MDRSKRRTRMAGLLGAAGMAVLATAAVVAGAGFFASPTRPNLSGGASAATATLAVVTRRAGGQRGSSGPAGVHAPGPDQNGRTVARASDAGGRGSSRPPHVPDGAGGSAPGGAGSGAGRGGLAAAAGASAAGRAGSAASAGWVASAGSAGAAGWAASAGSAGAAGWAASAARYAADLVAGVGPIPAGWVVTAHTLKTGGLTRVYLTIEPARATSSLPVVLLLHGRRMTPDTILRISGLAYRIGPAVLVVPAGWERSWNAGDCCGAAYRAGVNDVTFLKTVMKDVLDADPGARSAGKTYAVGFSNGGRLAYLLACEMPGVFNGFMAVEAVPVERCTPPRPLDMTIVAQQSDPLLTIGTGRAKVIGGFTEPTVAATVTRMQSVDHCAGRPSATDVGLAVERTWSCAGGTTVRYVWYPSGSHDWRPSTAGTPGATDVVLQMLGHGGLRYQVAGLESGPRTTS